MKLPWLKLPRIKLPRMAVSIGITVILGVIVSHGAPHQMPVALFKFYLVASAGVAGYYLDREMFPYARPDMFLMEPWQRGSLPELAPGEQIAFCVSMIRRAMLVVGYMLAVGLGA